jgi:alkylated DNA repair dioxygenase AlkB
MTEIKSIVEKCRVIDEVDNTKSIIYFDPNFYDDFKYPIELFNLQTWKGLSNFDIEHTKWEPPRLQIWSHLNKLSFHHKWNFDRWQHTDYTDWLLKFQQDTFEKIQPVLKLFNSHYDIKLPNINSVLLNKYSDQNSSIHLHQDIIPEFGINPTIIAASFGETRTFNLIRVKKGINKLIPLEEEKHLNMSFELSDKSLLIMAGSSQKYYAHEIPKTLVEKGVRISCIFREHNICPEFAV